MRIYIFVFCFWAATSPLHAKIVFISLRDENWEIYKMDADGGNQTRLTHNKVDDYAPVWSPNGRQIAFERYQDGNWEIYVMDTDGRNQRNLTNHPARDSDPHWHPDGTRIVFYSSRGASSKIYVMDTDGGNVEEIPHLRSASSPKWSPDGKWIAFERGGDSDEIQMIEPDTTQLHVISVRIPRPMSIVGWSPDGRQIMYMAAFDDAGNDAVLVIATLSRDGSGKVVGWKRVRLPRRLDGNPAWGADGKSILFLGDTGGNLNIYRYRLDNRKLIRLTDHPDSDAMPDEWHPLLTVSQQGLTPIPWGGIKSNLSSRILPLLTLPR